MGKYYDQAAIPDELRRTYDVYDRIKQLGITLGTFEENVRSLEDATSRAASSRRAVWSTSPALEPASCP